MHHSTSRDRRRAQDLALARDLMEARRIQAGQNLSDTHNMDVREAAEGIEPCGMPKGIDDRPRQRSGGRVGEIEKEKEDGTS